jgi:hypothetical protein
MSKVFFHRLILSVIVGGFLLACGPSEQEQAASKIIMVESLLEKGDTSIALLHLDSIPKLFPKAVAEADHARELSNRIYVSLIMKHRIELDTINKMIVVLEKGFNKEKESYDRYVNYIPKRQSFNRSWDRSYIQVNLNELGEIYLSSNYYGEQWLHHTGLRVYDGKDQSKTEKVDLEDVNNHRSEFMETMWERVTYKDGKSDAVIEFIANNSHRKLKAVFLGKRYYYILLEAYDMKAVKDAWELSILLKRKIQISKEIEGLQKKIEN